MARTCDAETQVAHMPDPDNQSLAVNRQWLREQLQRLSDAELLSFTVIAKADERLNYERGDVSSLVSLCWYETLRRGKPALFDAALAEVRRQEAEHRAGNAAALRELKEKR